jgi:hypothetical protein
MMAERGSQSTNYRPLSSVARVLLPKAENMHTEGLTWREIAQELTCSALHVWRKLEERTHDPEPPQRETVILGAKHLLPSKRGSSTATHSQEPSHCKSWRKKEPDTG